GGLLGAGLIASTGDVHLAALGTAFVLPLVGSPVIALLLTAALYPLLRWTRRRHGVTSTSCVCVGTTFEEVADQADGSLLLVRTGVTLQTGQMADCVERYRGTFLGVEAGG